MLVRVMRSMGRQVSSVVLLQSLAPHSSNYYSSSSAAKAASSSSPAAVEAERCIREGPRNNWNRDEINSVYHSPLLDLLFHGVSFLSHSYIAIQQCALKHIESPHFFLFFFLKKKIIYLPCVY